MHRIILICKIKITFQKVSDNFAFIKNCITLWHKCASARLRVCGSARLRVCASAGLRVCGTARLRVCASAGLRVCGSARLRVCASARLRVCASARLMAAKFSGPGKLLVSNFLGGWLRPQGPWGQALTPKGGLCQINILPGFWGRGVV